MAFMTIGELARRTGLPVRTIRFWSDRGVVPPTGRTDAGHRLYDDEALARLDLVRTLRELGVGLRAIERVLAAETTLAEVAGAHAAALEAQIRTLRLQRTVLLMVADRGTGPEELKTMHELAKLTAAERQRILDDFTTEVFAGVEADPGILARMRAVRPELPGDPSPEQVDAWIELAELVRDPAFRSRVRAMAVEGDRRRGEGEAGEPGAWQATARLVGERAGAAAAAGIDPRAAAAAPVLDEPAGAFARAAGREDGPGGPRLAAGAHRAVRRRPRRALLAAAGGHQRPPAGARRHAGVGVADRGPAGVRSARAVGAARGRVRVTEANARRAPRRCRPAGCGCTSPSMTCRSATASPHAPLAGPR